LEVHLGVKEEFLESLFFLYTFYMISFIHHHHLPHPKFISVSHNRRRNFNEKKIVFYDKKREEEKSENYSIIALKWSE
jgi:hypothetical protein